MKNIEKQIKDIDAKLAELEKQEKSKKPQVTSEPKDQTEEAIETIRECVKELLEIDDLKAIREENPELHSNRMLTIVSWFNYLKFNKPDTIEFEEAKKLVLSIGEKHPQLAKWCEEVIEKEKPKRRVSLLGAELNVDKTNELIIEDGAKIVVDADKAKKIIDTKWIMGSKEHSELQFEYKVVVNDINYDHLYHIVNYVPKCEIPEYCPYIVHLVNWKKNENGDRILIFNVLEIGETTNKNN